MTGECLSCERVSKCSETSIIRVLQDYTCPMFKSVSEPEYLARVESIQTYGRMALLAILNPTTPEK